MEENLKCKICGGVFLTTIILGLIVANIYICEPCRKKIDENPDFPENNYQIPFLMNTMSGINSTASVSATSYSVII